MKYFGLRTLTILTAFMTALILGFVSGRLDLSRLSLLSQEILLLIGFFAAIATWFIIVFFPLDEDEPYGLGFGHLNTDQKSNIAILFAKNDRMLLIKKQPEQVISAPSWILQTMLLTIFIIVGLISFNNRSWFSFNTASQRYSLNQDRFCEDETHKESEEPEKMGCKLIYKAFELGYTDDLGDCEKGKEDLAEQEVCRLRQKDEPFLHYSWRKFVEKVSGVESVPLSEKLNEAEKTFKKQMKSLNQLVAQKNHKIKGSPHAAHYVFTDLPYPDSLMTRWLNRMFRPGYCVEKARRLGHDFLPEVLEPHQRSQRVDRDRMHLLFNDQLMAAAGYCREFQVLWQRKRNTCEQLLEQPKLTLSRLGIRRNIDIVIDRFEAEAHVTTLKSSLQSHNEEKDQDFAPNNRPPIDPNPSTKKDSASSTGFAKLAQAISFHCLYKSAASDPKKLSSKSFTYRNYSFSVHMQPIQNSKSYRVDESFNQFARLMIPDFHYQPLNQSAEQQQAKVEEARSILQQKQIMPLARLEILRTNDIFRGDHWVFKDRELMEVYPWYLHLSRYVTKFRKAYRMKRGRL